MTNICNTQCEEVKPQRYLGLDILKVISTLLIIVHHLSLHGGFFNPSYGITRFVLIIANALFLPSVNIFVFVSSYLIIKKGKATIKNLLKIYFEVVFYSILTYFIYCLLNNEVVSLYTIYLCFKPISSPIFWFTQAYIIMYILSPLLLKIVNGLSKKEYKITLIVIAAILILPKLIHGFEFLPLSNGFNAIWFSILFLIAGYQVKFGFNFKKVYFLIVYMITTIILCLQIYKNGIAVNYTKILVLLQTLALFNLLYDIRSKNIILTNSIKYMATCTLGVYLLHDGFYTNPYIYNFIFKTYLYHTSPIALLYFALFVILIFIAGIVVETIRKLTLKGITLLVKKIREARQKRTSQTVESQ